MYFPLLLQLPIFCPKYCAVAENACRKYTHRKCAHRDWVQLSRVLMQIWKIALQGISISNDFCILVW